MSDDLTANLEQYRTQLQQVEAALLAEADNEELNKLKTDLEEVIALTVDLIGGNEETAAGPSSVEKEKKNEPLFPKHAGAPGQKWKPGDKCLALSSKSNAYYEATVDDIVADTAIVTFTAQGTTEMCNLTNLKSCQTVLDMSDHKKMFSSHKSVMAKKQDRQADRERRQKRKEKKAERLEKLEQSREADKNRWKSFNNKAANKKFKGVKRDGKSIFASPDGPYGRVGVTVVNPAEIKPTDKRKDMLFYGKVMSIPGASQASGSDMSPSPDSSINLAVGSLEQVHTYDAFPMRTPRKIGGTQCSTSAPGENGPSVKELHAVQSTVELKASTSGVTVDLHRQHSCPANDKANNNGNVASSTTPQPQQITASRESTPNAVDNKLPVKPMEPRAQPPFALLPGEYVHSYGTLQGEDSAMYLTNFRLFCFIGRTHGFYSVPIVCIDYVEVRDLFSLVIVCKDAKMFKVVTANNQSCLMWFKELTSAVAASRCRDDLFAFAFYAWCRSPDVHHPIAHILKQTSQHEMTPPSQRSIVEREYDRLKFNKSLWTITDINKDFGLCSSYPRRIILPASVADTDKSIKESAKFRFNGRLPVIVWHRPVHRVRNRCSTDEKLAANSNGKKESDSTTCVPSVVLMRSAQPQVGILGWRCVEDEQLLAAVVDCTSGSQTGVNGESNRLNADSPTNAAQNNGVAANNNTKRWNLIGCDRKSLLIVDARSYTAALANRAKGGGVESAENYQNCDVVFMGLANIHNIRASFQQLRSLLYPGSSESWLQNCQWMLHVSSLLCAAVRVVEALHDEHRSVLVHCSDGWDRTTQIVSLAKLMIDPYYRSMQGFKELVQMEWLCFGHKFSDRGGILNQDQNERSPVFLQWLDCVHQMVEQFPCAFEFSRVYLVKLAQHSYSSLFGTFICNSLEEWTSLKVGERTYDVWQYLHHDNMRPLCANPLYQDVQVGHAVLGVLWPRCGMSEMRLWRQLYCDGSYTVGGTDDHPSAAEMALMARQADYKDSLLKSQTSVHRAHSCDSLTEAGASSSVGDNTSLKDSDTMAQSAAVMLRVPSQQSTAVSAQSSVSNCGVFARSISFENNINQLSQSPIALHDGASRRISVTDWSTSDVGVSSSAGSSASHSNGTTTHATNTIQMHDQLVHSVIDASHAAITPRAVQLRTNAEDAVDAVSQLSPSMTISQQQQQKQQLQPQQQQSMLTSTTEISDSLTSAANQQTFNQLINGKYRETAQQQSQIMRHVDIDGLIKANYPEQTRMQFVIDFMMHNYEQMRDQLHAVSLQNEALKREVANQADKPTVVNGGGDDANPVPLKPITNGDINGGASLRSNGSLSESSWENVDTAEAQPTKWYPDHLATHCMQCDTAFSQINRKHHCRCCGKVFCAECSSFTSSVPSEQHFSPVRVCRRCFYRLKMFKTDGSNGTTIVSANAQSSKA